MTTAARLPHAELAERFRARVIEVARCETAHWPQLDDLTVGPLRVGHAMATAGLIDDGQDAAAWHQAARAFLMSCEKVDLDQVVEAVAEVFLSPAWEDRPGFDAALLDAMGCPRTVPDTDVRDFLAAWELICAVAFLAVAEPGGEPLGTVSGGESPRHEHRPVSVDPQADAHGTRCEAPRRAHRPVPALERAG